MDTPIVPPGKLCRKCGQIKPLTAEFFARNRANKSGFDYRCKACRKAYQVANLPDYAARQKKYTKANPDKCRESSRNWSKRNAAKFREKYRLNPEPIREKVRMWKKSHPADPRKESIRQHARRARMKSLPNTFELRHWMLCLEYFHNRCAVCGGQLRDLFGAIEPHADHWIAINDPNCIGTTPDNMVILCSDCNLSKGAKNPQTWLDQKFGKYKSQKIIKEVEGYFKWIVNQ